VSEVDDDDNEVGLTGADGKEIVCFKCGEVGHKATNCRYFGCDPIASKQRHFFQLFTLTAKMTIAPMQAARSEKCLPKNAVQFNSKFVTNDKTSALLSGSKRRRYQRRGSKSASMFQMDCLTVQQHHDEPSEESTPLSVFMNTSPDDPIDNAQQRRSTIEFYSQISLLEELAHLKRILKVSSLDKNEAAMA
jgi:hypothetical protein